MVNSPNATELAQKGLETIGHWSDKLIFLQEVDLLTHDLMRKRPRETHYREGRYFMHF